MGGDVGVLDHASIFIYLFDRARESVMGGAERETDSLQNRDPHMGLDLRFLRSQAPEISGSWDQMRKGLNHPVTFMHLFKA